MKNLFLIAIGKAFFFYRMLLLLLLTDAYSCKIYRVTRDGRNVTTWNTRMLKNSHPNGSIKTGHGIIYLVPGGNITSK